MIRIKLICPKKNVRQLAFACLVVRHHTVPIICISIQVACLSLTIKPYDMTHLFCRLKIMWYVTHVFSCLKIMWYVTHVFSCFKVMWYVTHVFRSFKVSATLKIAIFPYFRFQRFQIVMLESFLFKKKLEENIISVERYRG